MTTATDYTEKTVTIQWRGQDYEFRQMSWVAAQDSQDLLASIAEQLALLFGKPKDHLLFGSKHETVTREDGSRMELQESLPISAETWQGMLDNEQRAAKALVAVVTNQKQAAGLCRLILDACPDLQEGCIHEASGKVTAQAVQAFTMKVRIPDLVVLVSGLLQANAEAFGEAGKSVVSRIKSRLAEIKGSGASSMDGSSDF